MPILSVGPIIARNLLAPIEEVRGPPAAYRLDPTGQAAIGQRARLSIDVGEATLFVISGRLNRQAAPIGSLDASHTRAISQRRDSGKVYGAGVAHSISGVNLSATYQYSKIGSGQPGPDSEAGDVGPGKSHSLQAMARIRFQP